MSQPIQFFDTRKEGDIDMVAEVEKILLASGLINQVNAPGVFHGNPLIESAKLRIPIVQQHLLNRYWYFQLISVADKNTMEERLALTVGGRPEDWLYLFKERVVPFLIGNNLPTLSTAA